jgi:hypothetical protein
MLFVLAIQIVRILAYMQSLSNYYCNELHSTSISIFYTDPWSPGFQKDGNSLVCFIRLHHGVRQWNFGGLGYIPKMGLNQRPIQGIGVSQYIACGSLHCLSKRAGHMYWDMLNVLGHAQGYWDTCTPIHIVELSLERNRRPGTAENMPLNSAGGCPRAPGCPW